jgi:selenocysteine lyase/cysteine desulfurase
MPSPEEFRQRFAALQDTAHFASCSQGALSDTLASALLELQYTMREQGAPWGRWMDEVDTARAMFARLIGAEPDEVAVVSCASAAAFQVASTQNWADRPRIVTTDMEFPSIAHVWLAQQPYGAQIVHAPERDGILGLEDYTPLIDEQCSLVSVPLVSYRNGLRLPVQEIVEATHAAGAKAFVDAYQGAGVEAIDVHELNCDYLTSGSLKYLLASPSCTSAVTSRTRFPWPRPGGSARPTRTASIPCASTRHRTPVGSRAGRRRSRRPSPPSPGCG